MTLVKRADTADSALICAPAPFVLPSGPLRSKIEICNLFRVPNSATETGAATTYGTKIVSALTHTRSAFSKTSMSPGAATTTDGTAVVSALTRIRSERALKTPTGDIVGSDVLSALPWVQDLYAQPGVELLATVGAMSSSASEKVGNFDPDHLFYAMMRQGLIADIAFMYSSGAVPSKPGPSPDAPVFHTLVALGSDIAGHPRITHGGFTAAVIDETTGGLVYELIKAGLLGPGRAYTAHLEVDFKAPLPVGIVVCCTATLVSVEGRKIWVTAEMVDRPGDGKKVYATGKALYVTPRQEVAPQEDPLAAAPQQ